MKNPLPTKRRWLAIPLMAGWLVGTVYAFWWFQVRDLRSFDQDQVAVFEGKHLAEQFRVLPASLNQGTNAQPLVVHFWNPDCGCNKFNNPHVRDIVEQYSAQGVQFLTVVRAQAGQDEQALLNEAQTLFNIPAILESNLQLDADSAPSATPAAAVINPQGQLAYYGPYSDSAFCGANGSAFVEKTLDKVLDGKATESLNTLAFGCFCQWKQGTTAHVI